MAGLETYKPKRAPHTPSHLLQNERVAEAVIYNTRSSRQRDLQGQHKRKLRTVKRPKVSVHSCKISSGRSDDGGPCGRVSGLEEVDLEQFQSTIKVLQEALNANTSQLAALKLTLELEAAKKETERVTAELNQIKAETTSRISGFKKTVEGFFVRRQNI
ncbi:hypothetical protein V502_08478 [Pseudogymnoascus sp. VKM F-4520 (FW-2644)]|nr:hypothetical protein V502_08478 [Pseudogymnoascus sp. VKM F-4520 (FW-2644)]